MTDHVIVLPGGGYEMHADHEAEPVAEWLGSIGIEASVFRYPLRSRHPAVLDAIRAEVRARRAAGADRIALLGFSAGGHAAGHAALAPGAAAEERVDAVVLGYPVVSMLFDTHAGSRTHLLGADASPELRAETSLERLVTPAAPPFFVWHTSDDPVVPVAHSLALSTALAEAGVRHALHVYPSGHGGHGLGLARDRGLPSSWTGLCAAWFGDLGWRSAR